MSSTSIEIPETLSANSLNVFVREYLGLHDAPRNPTPKAYIYEIRPPNNLFKTHVSEFVAPVLLVNP